MIREDHRMKADGIIHGISLCNRQSGIGIILLGSMRVPVAKEMDGFIDDYLS